ncbi:MAG: DUF2284 domain-containing protein [Bacteroidales bacterium]|nr:DUF2284 domain-containing protein [Bacteroidales bacterium]
MKTETFRKELALADYVRDFRDAERFLVLCRQCPRYGRAKGCPPFADGEVEGVLSRCRRVEITVTRITLPADAYLTYRGAHALTAPVRREVLDGLVARAEAHAGHVLGFGGAMDPAQQRPSLEAYGFDISRTLAELFGLELLWSPDGEAAPPVLTYVAAILF